MDRGKIKNLIRASAAYVVVAVLAGIAGWFFGVRVAEPKVTVSSSGPSSPAREGGYDFVNPLLICSRDNATAVDAGMQTLIQNTVNTEIKNGNVIIASVYYRRFLDGDWAVVNGGETYYPASLNKVPLMIAYYNLAEETGTPLTKNIYFPAGLPDQNAQQEIRPDHPIAPGESYTADELVNASIKDSDNNATLLLLNAISTSTLQTVFSDLQVPFLAQGETPINYMTVTDYAFFFRVLYNATYLSHADSEKALDILSETTFNDGIVAGVPAGTTVAHKFGLVSVAPNGTTVTARELHDCGIVYPKEQDPYLLCVMTRSTGSLQGVEQAIADISRSVYKQATE
ncbi:MAG: serine hydrolase [Minisyncoccia bacterium]